MTLIALTELAAIVWHCAMHYQTHAQLGKIKTAQCPPEWCSSNKRLLGNVNVKKYQKYGLWVYEIDIKSWKQPYRKLSIIHEQENNNYEGLDMPFYKTCNKPVSTVERLYN